jgi:hypothetical protein
VLNGYPITRLWQCDGCHATATGLALPEGWRREEGETFPGHPWTVVECPACTDARTDNGDAYPAP